MLQQVRKRLIARSAELNKLHAQALERNNPTLHPLAIAIRIEEIERMISIIDEELQG